MGQLFYQKLLVFITKKAISMIRQIIYFCVLFFFSMNLSMAQNILPSPMSFKKIDSEFVFKQSVHLIYDKESFRAAVYLKERLGAYIKLKENEIKSGSIQLSLIRDSLELGKEGYMLKVTDKQIKILAKTETGIFYGIQSLLQLLPDEVQAGEGFKLSGIKINGLEIIDKPKYAWRSFMLDSGRQYQTPDFIKRYLNYMAMLKMNVFHWHLSEGQGWRIEIKKYPKLTEIGSQVAKGKEQQGFYTQEEIKSIIAFAEKLHITVVPEIDIPGHSEAALTAYPEMTCFRKAPETVMAFSPNLFCGGRDETYNFIQNILDEICELFPSEHIHLGGDEAPKANWNKCPDCQNRIKNEKLTDSHELQLYFSSRLAKYLKTKGRKVIFWGDVVYHEGLELPDNVVVHWWNWRRHKDLALKNAIKRGHQVICNTNNYTYLNFPLIPWSKYSSNRTFDLKKCYKQNPSDIENPNELILGMGCSLWTDWYVKESMIDQRVFPRIFVMAEQMWNNGNKVSFDSFYKKVKAKYPLLSIMKINYGPALSGDVPVGYKWD